MADARFFWDQDRRKKLIDRLPQLEGVVFHARLGTMAKKAKRISKLARTLYFWIDKDVDPDKAKQAARAGLLCKADLVTEMVGEFPELQGIIGNYYAQADKEEPAVWFPIRNHYGPHGPGDQYPVGPVGIAVALADKLDTLVGFFAIDERPTGSKDPFALRRAALGVIRLILENEPPVRLPLSDAFKEALDGYDDMLPTEPGAEATCEALLAFFADRLRVHLRDLGHRHDLVNAVFSVDGEDDLVRLLARVDTLADFLDGEDGINLLTAYRRAANILRIEEKKDGRRYEGKPDPALFAEAEERTLHEQIIRVNNLAEHMLSRESFGHAMTIMSPLRAPVDAFFDHVTVNCDDPALRRNRLLMLSQIRSTLDGVADFSKIEG